MRLCFNNCVNLKSIIISDSITSLSYAMFISCTALENVELPSTLKKIEGYSLAGCSSLKSINIPESVNEIGASAFDHCENLTNIKLPGNLKIIPQGMFTECNKLEKISIPQGVTDIQMGAFYGCDSLKTVSIPDTVEKMESYVFFDCNLETVYYGGSFESWMKLKGNNNKGFENAKEYCNQYVPVIIMVNLNGVGISFEQPPVIVDGRTLVPLRAIFEAMGSTVDWNDGNKTVTSKLGTTTVQLTIGSNILYKNGTEVILDVPAQLINGHTMVPARAVAEAFGADVKWNGDTQTVYITTNGNMNTEEQLV